MDGTGALVLDAHHVHGTYTAAGTRDVDFVTDWTGPDVPPLGRCAWCGRAFRTVIYRWGAARLCCKSCRLAFMGDEKGRAA